MMKSLASKRIVVTGGASGMGATMVEGFAREGARVVAFYRRESGDAVIAKLDAEEADRVHFLQCDVSNKAEVSEAMKAAEAWLGGVDILVNAAAIAPRTPSDKITLEEWEEVFAINARGTFLTNQAVFPFLRENAGGAIVNFASAAGVNGQALKAHYSASKGAVLAWTRSIALEWAPYGITANAVAPAIWTPMYEKSTRATMSPERLLEHDHQMARMIPLGGRLGDPVRDFLPYMIFLCGDGARFITGQTIKIDGGLMMLS